jgi:23S rRNA pseudouridine1911/1915/1917 synthase
MTNMTEQIIQEDAKIPEELAGKRLDQVLAILFPNYSRSRLQAWLSDKKITINGEFARAKDKVKGGEHLHLKTSIVIETAWLAEKLDLLVIYQDESLLVINKPIGMVVHPAVGNRQGTLVNALLHHFPELAHIPRAGVVHRLDKNTSGLLVVAKTLAAHTSLVKQLQKRTIRREYEAIAYGQFTAGGTVDAPLGRHPRDRKRMAIIESGKPAVTHYRVLERFQDFTRLRVNLETGRTHQIRVHMSSIHHPLLGDATYGGRTRTPKRASLELLEGLRQFKHQALHAKVLGLEHPVSRTYVEWTAPVPEDFQMMVELLRKNNALT